MLLAPDSLPPDQRPRLRPRTKTPAKSSQTAPVTTPLPRWTRLAPTPKIRPESLAFSAGANLLALDRVFRANPHWAGCLRQRQALDAAVVSARLMRLSADELSLRDAQNLTRSGDDPGPAGKIFRAWIWLAAHPARLEAATLQRLAATSGLGEINFAPADLADVENLDPVASAAAVARAVFGAAASGAPSAKNSDLAAAEILALMAADLALAARLAWPMASPLFAAGLFDPSLRAALGGRRLRLADPAWPKDCYALLGRACEAAHARARELERRAETFLSVTTKIRTKGRAPAIDAFLQNECVAPWRLAKKLGSDRAARRFCDRLVELGGARELTGRTTFRLYGL